MFWNEADHPKDEFGKFANNGKNETPADILYKDSKIQREKEKEEQEYKKKLLDILDNKSTPADVLYANPDKLEKKIKEKGLESKLQEIKTGAELPIREPDITHNGVKLKGKIPTESDLKSKNSEITQEPFKLRAEINDQNEVNVSNVQPKKDEQFDEFMKHIHIAEGGFVDNPNDRGGRTNMGITQKTFDAYNQKHGLAKKDVKDITKEEADEIYGKEYWEASGANKIKDKKLAYMHFDAAINHGVSRAKKFLEQSEGDFDKYCEIRKNFYTGIIKNDSTQAKFEKGWNNRLNKIKNMKFD